MSETIFNNFRNIKLKPENFSDYLLHEVGFSRSETVALPAHQSKGFQRPLQIFTKPLQSSNISSNTKEIRWKKKSIKKIQEEIDTPQTDNLKREQNNLKSLVKEGLEGEIALKETKKVKENFDVCSSLLKDTGIKSQIIKKYLPIMNQLINKYLNELDFYVSFDLNENFEETIKSRFRDEFCYASFSEGEKMRIDLALLFTWRTIAKMKNSANTNLLILDEIFDSSLDIAGTYDFMKILRSFNDSTNVFIISHKTDVLQDKFDRILRVEKKQNFSVINEESGI